MRHVTLSILLTSFVSLAARGFADDSLAEMQLVVINDKAPLAVSGKVVGTVKEGWVFPVESVEGDWIWIKSERAYIRRSDAIPFDEAIAHYTRRKQTDRIADIYWSRARIWQLKGKLDNALDDMNSAIRLKSNKSVWFNDRGLVWFEKKEIQKAHSDYDEAIRLNPKNRSAYHNRAVVWDLKNEPQKAIADYTEAIKYAEPNDIVLLSSNPETSKTQNASMGGSLAMTYYNRGSALEKIGQFDDAIADYNEAVQLARQFEEPRASRRLLWKKTGAWDEVLAELEATIKDGSIPADTADQIAWIRATCPNEDFRNGDQAVEYALKACELTEWKRAKFLDTLAAAYATRGEFDEAVEWELKSLAAAAPHEVEEFDIRLELYRDQVPYRDMRAK